MMDTNSSSHLLPIDWIVMGAYLVFLIGLGIYYRRYAEASIENFFLGGRKLKGWLTGTSFAATFYNAEVGSVYVGLTVSTGMFICWWFFSRFGLALLIAAVLFAVFWRRLNIFTSPEFYELRFPGKAGTAVRTWVTVRSACIAVVAWTGAGLLGLSFVAQELLGWSKLETLVVVVPIILVYVYLSGYMGVVVSDVIQGIILIGTTLLLSILVLVDFGGEAGFLAGPGALRDALLTALPENPEVVSWLPPVDHEFLGMLGIFCWIVGKSFGYGGDTAPVGATMEGQRLLSTKSPREASKMYLWTVGLLFLMLTVLTLPGLGALAHRPELYTASAAERETAFGWLLGQYMPPGLLGLALLALFAAIMSTVDSNMNLGAQVLLNDIYKRFIGPEASVKEYMMVGRVAMICILAAGVIIAIAADSVIAFAVLMLQFSSAELPANWAQWWWWRFNGAARMAASFGGVVFFLINRFLIFDPMVAAGDISGSTAAYLVVLTSMGATTLLWVTVALLTPPDPEEDLVAFYREARPIGLWGPIASKVDGVDEQRWSRVFKGLGIAIVGFLALCSATLVLYALYLGYGWLALVAFIVAVCAGFIFFNTYKRFIGAIERDFNAMVRD